MIRILFKNILLCPLPAIYLENLLTNIAILIYFVYILFNKNQYGLGHKRKVSYISKIEFLKREKKRLPKSVKSRDSDSKKKKNKNGKIKSLKRNLSLLYLF